MKFSPEYVACVLNENFEDAKAQFLEPLMAIHRAHLIMLTECGIVPRDEARQIGAALSQISLDEIRAVRYDGTYEDLFFYVERLIVERCGDDVAGRLHTARSRNDIDMTMYRMQQREPDPGAAGRQPGAARHAAGAGGRAPGDACSPRTPIRSRRSRPPSRTTCSR